MVIYDVKELVDRAQRYYLILKHETTYLSEAGLNELQNLNRILFSEMTDNNLKELHDWLEEKELIDLEDI
jgi:hypothetical protein